ncbi:MAG: HNH endonuclease [Cryobacterium sp.]|uniref:HNH endonuclease signature motif containing protein n=1 Tax=unclassified Cryobacterium TaxID=2649013 RepID=UPI0018CB86FD|nr:MULTISPECIES: HNH endonuclease signature motif containing protein [unclassified Cryobacterium]MCY7405783.1 HNH endonuclease [Cryobacterium sp.]MEC5155494.1 hypothetical protein [Cryobacterium sp. CAN_C3]
MGPGTLLGGRRPGVHLIVSQHTGQAISAVAGQPIGQSSQQSQQTQQPTRPAGQQTWQPTQQTGHGFIEGNPGPISPHTIEALCADETLHITLDQPENCVDVGREQRTSTPAQRSALAARGGGCMWPDCAQPPSWSEVHHRKPWSDGGRTDFTNSILLCRANPLRLHNEGWKIYLDNEERYWLQPPGRIDPEQKLSELRSKSPTAVEQREEARGPVVT